MRICINSCTIIRSLQQSDSVAAQLLDLIDYELTLVVTRNLNTPDSEDRSLRRTGCN